MTNDPRQEERERRLAEERAAGERWAAELAEVEQRLQDGTFQLQDGRMMPDTIEEQRRRKQEAAELLALQEAAQQEWAILQAADKEIDDQAKAADVSAHTRHLLPKGLLKALGIVPVVGIAVYAAVAFGSGLFEKGSKVEAGAAGPCVAECLAAQREVMIAYADDAACDGATSRVCLVPVGGVTKATIEQLVGYYGSKYGLEVSVLPPINLEIEVVSANDRKQAEAEELIALLWETYPQYSSDPNVSLLGVTPVDMYSYGSPLDPFALAVNFTRTRETRPSVSIISTARLDPRLEADGKADDPKRALRLQKLANSQVGLMHFKLSPSTDPKAPMYGNVKEPWALDLMGEHLAIEQASGSAASSQTVGTSPAPGTTITPPPAATVATPDEPVICSAACLLPDIRLAATYQDPTSCNGTDKRICILPIGSASSEIIEGLVSYYRSHYGIDVRILPPMGLFPQQLDAARNQVADQELKERIETRYATYQKDPNVRLIAVTSVDMFMKSYPTWAYAFANAWDYGADGSFELAIVSYARMNPTTFGLRANEALFLSRIQKMVNKEVGLLYYGLPTDPSPTSPMFNGIVSPADLDRMAPHLPISR